MWFKITSYFSFLLKSTNEHGVHSPFVFQLVTLCFYKKTSKQAITTYTTLKKSVLKKFPTFKKKGIHNKKAFLLIRLIPYLNIKTILQIGTSINLNTLALSIGNSKITIQTLNACENTANISKKMIESFNLNNIVTICSINETLNPLIINNTFDLIYFDGNFKKETTLYSFKSCLESIHNNSVFIFENIYENSEMLETWEEIKKHPLVTVTINTYFWGIVFFRKEQAKQHFTIRI